MNSEKWIEEKPLVTRHLSLFKYSTGFGIGFLPIVFWEAWYGNALGDGGVYEFDFIAYSYYDTYMADAVALSVGFEEEQVADFSLA